MAADWANPPTDLLALIAHKLPYMEDFILFGAVCKSWSTFISEEKKPLPPKFPRLMLAETLVKGDGKTATTIVGDDNSKDIQPRGFFSLSSGKVYELDLPEASGRRCLGANYGWLLTLGVDLQINLLHPYTRRQISLPPFLAFSDQYEYDEDFQPHEVIDFFIRKAVLSSNPWRAINNNASSLNDDDENPCEVMAIYGEFCILAIARLGDKLWTNVAIPDISYDDIVYYKGQFYVVDSRGNVFVCDIDAEQGPSLSTPVAPNPFGFPNRSQKYLVEFSGDLLLVSRVHKYDTTRLCHTSGFSVLKMEKCSSRESEYPFCWVKMNNLGDRALFLGNNSSISLSVSEEGRGGCFKANCIYFGEDNSEYYRNYKQPGGGGRDMGVFNMENGTIEPHYLGLSVSPISPPLWII